MVTDAERTRLRTRVFVDQVLAPAVFAERVPLAVAAWQPSERVSAAEARAAARDGEQAEAVADVGAYQSVELGWRFGPVWSSCWFRLRGHLSERLVGRELFVRFSCGTEALLWRHDAPAHGFDANRDLAPLGVFAAGGTAIDLFVEAHVNHPLGVATFWWDAPEVHARWKEKLPGRLERAELVVLDHTVFELCEAMRLAADLVAELGDDSLRANRLRLAIERARAQIDTSDPTRGALVALAIVQEALSRGTPPSASACYAIGHAHLDTAWLWTFARTREKVLRTYANAVQLLERFPRFRFLASQPQQLAWLAEDAPELFARVADFVEEGRVELHAAPWIEPDGNLPSGEALCRQLAYGSLWMRERFGEAGAQRMLWLPDTFGFAATWPQLAALAGLDTFVTNKMWWSEREDFPHCHFVWRGLDGTELLAHVTPGQDYNTTLSAAELRRGERVLARHDRVDAGLWLQPFGFGDGGGGPTPEQIVRAELADDCEGLPRVRLDGATAFCEDFHERAEVLARRGEALPVWDGELYLENHRGTLTTQGALKRGNARAQAWLVGLEAALATWPIGIDERERDQLLGRLRADWFTVLLHQFHDVLPGSCTADVAQEARAEYERLDHEWLRLSRGLSERIADTLDTRGLVRPALAINLSSTARTGSFGDPFFVDPVLGGVGAVWAEDVPPFGYRVVDAAAELPAHVARPSAFVDEGGAAVIECETTRGVMRVELGSCGGVLSLEVAGREYVVPHRELGELVLLDDRPIQWEAWNVDREALGSEQLVDAPAQWSALESGETCAGFECERALGAHSTVRTRVWCAAGDDAVHVEHAVLWREERTWLRALFPVDVRANRATCEVPFGHVERVLARNDAAQRAAFETPIQRFVDVSEPGRGLAVIVDCKHGVSHESIAGGAAQIGVSLLRSPNWPDPTTDRTEAARGVRHRVRFTLVPHAGDWRSAGVLERAETAALGTTLMPLPAGRAGDGARCFAPLSIDVEPGSGPLQVQIASIAPSWRGEALLVRLVERAGARGVVRVRWSEQIGMLDDDEHPAVCAVDLLERERPEDGVVHEGASTTVPLRPFQVVTLRVAR
jgi:alpha-mannosidase